MELWHRDPEAVGSPPGDVQKPPGRGPGHPDLDVAAGTGVETLRPQPFCCFFHFSSICRNKTLQEQTISGSGLAAIQK